MIMKKRESFIEIFLVELINNIKRESIAEVPISNSYEGVNGYNYF
jgi:hypothetical protein